MSIINRIVLLILIAMCSACDDNFMKPDPIKYRFHPVNLPDGTPCYVVRGGRHSGMVGITCDYGR